MNIQYTQCNQVGVVKVCGRLDAYKAKELKQALASYLESSNRLVIDCCELTYLDSSGLGALLSGLKKAVAGDGDIYLAGVLPRVKMTLEITGADKLFEMYPTKEKACAGFTGTS